MRILTATAALTAAILLTGCGPTMKFVSLQPQPSTQTVTFTTRTTGGLWPSGHVIQRPSVAPANDVVVRPVP